MEGGEEGEGKRCYYNNNNNNNNNSREGTVNSSRDVYCAKVTDTLPPILPACRQPLLPACVFDTRDTVRHPRRFCSENLFMMGGVREPTSHSLLMQVYPLVPQQTTTCQKMDLAEDVER